ncbi:MAG: class I SAM-dependent methyltransferase [Culicoidibacterales bacterium]
MTKVNVQGYLENINAPWGQLFYQLIWHNMPFVGKRILDFGSGFGVSANYFAKANEVIAIEPNLEMIEHRLCEHEYTQIQGDIAKLAQFEDGVFDVVICHNVFEYVDNREEIIAEFHRVLKPNGIISLVKHNKQGKIMQKVVFENNVEEAMSLIAGEDVASVNFGHIAEYENQDLEAFCQSYFTIADIQGIRIFFGLQRNEMKVEDDWFERMFQVETVAQRIPAFRDIAFFQHIILEKQV